MHRAYRVGLGSAWFIVVCGSAAIGQTSTAPSVDLTGKWSLTVQTDNGLQLRCAAHSVRTSGPARFRACAQGSESDTIRRTHSAQE